MKTFYNFGARYSCIKDNAACIGIKPDRRQSKTLYLSTNVDHKSSGDKWQSKTRFIAIIYPRSSIFKTFSIAAYPGGAV